MLPERVHVPAPFLVTPVGLVTPTPAIVRTELRAVTVPVVALLRVTVLLAVSILVIVVPTVILVPFIKAPFETPTTEARVSVVAPLLAVTEVVVFPIESTMAPAISPKPLPVRTSVFLPVAVLVVLAVNFSKPVPF